MLKSTYYKVETAGGVLYVKTWDTGCLIIKREGNLYKVENHSIPYKRQEGDIITEIIYFEFKLEFTRAQFNHKELQLK